MNAHAIFQKISSPDGLIKLETCAKYGGSISQFTYNDMPVMRGYDAALPPPSIAPDLLALNMAGFPLTPYSNRIGHGKLHFEGQTYDITSPLVCGDHPNHGDGLGLAWNVSEHTAHKLVLDVISENNPPYQYKATQTFKLDNAGLTLEISMTNISGLTLPFGTGHHTYYPRNDQTILKFDAPKVWESENMLPSKLVDAHGKFYFADGKILSPENLAPAEHGDDKTAYIDHCYQNWNQKAEIIWQDRGIKLIIGADPIFENIVLYAPSNQNFICLEPVTNITDGFNQMDKYKKNNVKENTGTIVLEHNESLKGKMTFKPRMLG